MSEERIQIAEVSIFEPESLRELVIDLKESDSKFSFELVGGTKIENSDALRVYVDERDVETTDLLEFAATVSGSREVAQFIFDLGYRSKELRSLGVDMDWDALEDIKERERDRIKR